MTAALLLATLTAHAARTHAQDPSPSGACRRHLMQVDHLGQPYTSGAGMRLQVPTVPNGVEGLAAAHVYEAAWRKLAAHGLHDADATH